MEIVLEVSQTPPGRLVGTARVLGGADTMTFSGAMELLACIERLCDRVATPTDPAPGREPGPNLEP